MIRGLIPALFFVGLILVGIIAMQSDRTRRERRKQIREDNLQMHAALIEVRRIALEGRSTDPSAELILLALEDYERNRTLP